jgi:uncharacterized protein YgiM (DUF1202 family)
MSFIRFAGACAIFAALTVAASARPVTLGSETNLRKAPGTKSEVVTLIPKGEKVEVGTCDAGWCQVTWNGQDGYAIGRNLGQARVAQHRISRRYANDGYVRVPPPGYDDDDEPYVAGPPVYYGYYPYPGAYWRGAYGWRGGWHHHWR